MNGANGEEYHVTVGEVDCEAVSVKDTEVVCRLPKAFEPIPRENPDIKVSNKRSSEQLGAGARLIFPIWKPLDAENYTGGNYNNMIPY